MLRFLGKCKGQTTLINAFHNFTQSFRFICLTSCSSSDSSNISSNDMNTLNNNSDSLTTMSFLKNPCGFSTKSHIYASTIARIETLYKPNSVFQFFQTLELSKPQIQDIFCRYPLLFLSNVEETLKPKIDFFLSLGISQSVLNEMIILYPAILNRSLNNHLIPLFETLKTIVGCEGNALIAIKRYPVIFGQGHPTYLSQNVTTLCNFNVPHSRVLKFITTRPDIITRPPHRFSNVVSSVKEMGFDPSSSAFIFAITAMARGNDLNWSKKFENFISLGFSENEIFSMFKKQPICMSLSVDRIKVVVDFYVNNLYWSTLQLSIRPQVLLYSLEKRIIPRCSVLQVLWSRNMLDKRLMLTTILSMVEKIFLQTYVNIYKDEVPEVLDAYQGKLKFDEYNFDAKGIQKDASL